MFTAHDFTRIIERSTQCYKHPTKVDVTRSVVFPEKNLVLLRDENGGVLAVVRVDYSMHFRPRPPESISDLVKLAAQRTVPHEPLFDRATLQELASAEVDDAVTVAAHLHHLADVVLTLSAEGKLKQSKGAMTANVGMLQHLAKAVLCCREAHLAKREAELAALQAQKEVQ